MKLLFPFAAIAIAIAGGSGWLSTTGANPTPILSDRPVVSKCLGVTLPAGSELALLGAYEGGGRARPRQAGEHSPGTIAVSAGNGGPLVLMLSAYEPVHWDLSGIPVGRLRGIIADGYDAGSVTGVSPDVPVRIVARGGPNVPSSCGEPVIAFQGGPRLDQLAAQAEAATGLKVSRFNGDYAPRSLSVEQPAIDWKRLLGRPDRRATGRDIYPGVERLSALVAQGAIRPATEADVADYNNAATRLLATGRLAPYRAPHLDPGSTYVVRRRFTVPNDMYGANSRSFIIPRGIAAPDDHGSPNSFYWQGDARCAGAACGADD